jgi:hypothetical protein
MPIGFITGSHWGINGIAAAWTMTYPIVLVPLYTRTFKQTQMRLKEYLSTLLPALSASAIMAICVVTARFLFGHPSNPLLSLLISIIVGVTSYLAALFLFHRDRVIGLAHTLKFLRKTGLTIEGPSGASFRR